MRAIWWALVVGGLLTGCLGTYNRPIELINEVGPVYPEAAKQSGIEGYVVVRYNIDVDGVVSDVEVVEARPQGVFDEAAKETILSWRYKAPILDGQPQAVRGVVSRVTFRLDEDDVYADL
ncbi:MAG: energy transducer TonB [Proteobacteria bacterium]|nr:energy transducer TonB [Pseudomonadota bacterium]